VTGTREKLPNDLEFAVRKIKEQTKKPVAVGFGISNQEQMSGASHTADGVIIGSAIVRIVEENLKHSDPITPIRDFVFSLANTLRSL
jgi:tryptophan synthase alpha chain